VSQSDVELIREAYAAFGRGDIAAVMANFAEDIEWNAPDVLPHGMRVRGHEGVGRFFATLAGRWSDFGMEIHEVADGERAVLGRGHASGKLDGTPTGYGFVHAFTVEGGKVVAFDEYVAPPEGCFPSA
jgi:uncharacterized protein